MAMHRFTGWPLMASLVREGTLTAVIIITLIGIAVGHFLGGPDEDDMKNKVQLVARDPGVVCLQAVKSQPNTNASDPVKSYCADTGSVSSTFRIEAIRRILRLWRVSPIKPAINTRPAIAAGRTIVVSPIERNFTPAASARKGVIRKIARS